MCTGKQKCYVCVWNGQQTEQAHIIFILTPWLQWVCIFIHRQLRLDWIGAPAKMNRFVRVRLGWVVLCVCVCVFYWHTEPPVPHTNNISWAWVWEFQLVIAMSVMNLYTLFIFNVTWNTMYIVSWIINSNYLFVDVPERFFSFNFQFSFLFVFTRSAFWWFSVLQLYRTAERKKDSTHWRIKLYINWMNCLLMFVLCFAWYVTIIFDGAQ